MTLAQRVRDYRYAKGWGPEEMARMASISRTALYQIESGKTEHPRAGTLRRIALALGISTENLLDITHPAGLGAHPTAPIALPHDRHDDLPPAHFRLDEPRATSRDHDLDRKFRELLDSPLGEGFARIIEESHRFLPKISPLQW